MCDDVMCTQQQAWQEARQVAGGREEGGSWPRTLALTATQQPAALQLIGTLVPPLGYRRTMGLLLGYYGTVGSLNYRTIEVHQNSLAERHFWVLPPEHHRAFEKSAFLFL